MKQVASIFFVIFALACNAQAPPVKAPKQLRYRVVGSYPHDSYAYTQGLQIYNGELYESIGQYGQSALRKLDPQTGAAITNRPLARKYFGEGMCVFNGLIFQLTWREQTCFIYRLDNLESLASMSYAGEGWGLTTDGQRLIMSDGSSQIKFLSPADMSLQKTLHVRTDKGLLRNLNELELVRGELWANVYGENFIARIDTASGVVTGILNLPQLLPAALRDRHTDVLNGIAYDERTSHFWLTGKNWKRIFEVEIFE
ncbi:MAG: glutaminyl-peptide cyclotransferase [Prevotellaceae bacterium]|jgi:glutaminyl-peptide cyclotransferase|nr:glutaminyl-peptide cyclotransferase [Prevotellaceae bacterium]